MDFLFLVEENSTSHNQEIKRVYNGRSHIARQETKDHNLIPKEVSCPMKEDAVSKNVEENKEILLSASLEVVVTALLTLLVGDVI